MEVVGIVLLSFFGGVFVLYCIYFFFIKPANKNLVGKNVIITGGSTGIGKSLAILMARERANVTIIARTKSKLDETEEELKGISLPTQRMLSISCDVTSKDDVARAIEESTFAVGPPDILVCCAGLATPGYFIEQDIDIFEYTMKVDYLGTVYATKAAVPHMIKNNRGTLVFVASAVAVCGFIGYSTYTPAKYAVRGFAEVLRNELKPYNIDVALVYPPDTQTPGFDRENQTKPPETVEISAGGTLASADDVAKQILHGIKRGDYHINADVMTKLFIMGSNGLTPRQFGLFEILLSPFITIFEMAVSVYFDSVVTKHHKARIGSKKLK